MYPTVRRTATQRFAPRLFALSNRALPTVFSVLLSVLAVLFLPAAIKAEAQTVTFNGQQTTLPATGLNSPYGAAVDSVGNVYIADRQNNRVVKLPAGGGAQTTTGVGLNSPAGVAVDAAGNVYIADTYNNRVVKVPVGGGAQTTMGTGLSYPIGVAVDGSGNVYIADNYNRVVEVPVGGGAQFTLPITNLSPSSGSAGVAVDGPGNVYIVDSGNNRVVELPAGAGLGTQVTLPATGLQNPNGIAVDVRGNVYIADSGNNRVVKVPVGGGAQTTMGTGLNYPIGVGVDGPGNVYIADTRNSRIVELSQSVNFGSVAVRSPKTGNRQTLTYTFQSADTLTAINVLTQGAANKDFTSDAATTCATGKAYAAGGTCMVVVNLSPVYPGLRAGAVQLADGNGTQVTTLLRAVATGPQIAFLPPTRTTFPTSGLNGPHSVDVDGLGNVYVADTNNARVTKTTPGGAQTAVGTGLIAPVGVALDGAGNVYIADQGSNGQSAIYVVAPSGIQTTVPAANLNDPSAIAVDGMGNLYILNNGNAVSKIAPNGTRTTIPTPGLRCGTDLALDAAGDVYISAGCDNEVMKVMPDGAQTIVPVRNVRYPIGVAVDAAGDIYIGNAYSANVVVVYPSGTQITVVPSTGLIVPESLNIDGAGNLYVVDYNANSVVELSPTPPSLSFASTTVGATSTDSPQTITVSNIGNADLTFAVPGSGMDPSFSGPDFAYSNVSTCPQLDTASSAATLASGASCTALVSFRPTVAGSLSESLNIADNNLNASSSAVQTIALAGTAVQVSVPPVAPSYSLTSSSSSLSIKDGQSGTAMLTLTPTGGYNGSVQFSCAGLPAGTSCSFSQNPVALNGNNLAANVTLTIQTDLKQARLAAPAAPGQGPLSPILPTLVFWWPGSLAGLAAFGRKGKRGPKQCRWLQFCLLVLLTGAFTAGFAGCGSGSSFSTPAGSSSLRVVATGISGVNTATQTMVLTVNIVQ